MDNIESSEILETAAKFLNDEESWIAEVRRTFDECQEAFEKAIEYRTQHQSEPSKELKKEIDRLSTEIWNKNNKFEMDCIYARHDHDMQIREMQTNLNTLKAEYAGTLRPAKFYTIYTDFGKFKVVECDDRQDDFDKRYIDSGNYFLDRATAENAVSTINSIFKYFNSLNNK